MPPAFGYVRAPATCSAALPAAEVQRTLIERFCTQQGLPLTAVFADAKYAASRPWLARPAGQALAAQLSDGCHVVTCGPAVFTRSADLLGIVQAWAQRGITLHLALNAKKGRFLTASGAAGAALITALQAAVVLGKSGRSAAVSAGMRDRRTSGRRWCHYAGYGFRWHRGRLAIDEYERAVIGRLRQWRAAGYSINQLAIHLLHHHVVTKEGREWSAARIRRALLTAWECSPDLNGETQGR